MKRKKLTRKEKIDHLIDRMIYENAPGIHTYSMCDCGRQQTRSGECFKCLKEKVLRLIK